MTVASAVSRISYNGNGSTTAFAVPYYFLENSHLRVILRSSAGVETVQTITTNYTVTGAENPAGGTVNMLVAPASGETLTILRDVPETQETDYQANDPFPAESHERALDKLTMIAQQIADESGRAIKIPETETSNTTLPASGTRANKLLGFSAGGDVALSNSTITQVDAAVSSFVNATGNNAASILYDPAGTGAQQTTVQAKLREIISVKDFGAVGDGVTDDTAAFQAAIATGKDVFIPDVDTNYLVSDSLGTLSAYQTIEGEGFVKIIVDNTGSDFVVLTLSSNTAVSNIWFDGMTTTQGTCLKATSGSTSSDFCADVSITNCWLRFFNKGYSCDQTFDIHFYDTQIRNNKYGVYLDPLPSDPSNGYLATYYFNGCRFYANSTRDIYLNSVGTASCRGINFESCTFDPTLGSNPSIYLNKAALVNFNGCYFEASTDGTVAQMEATDSIFLSMRNSIFTKTGGIDLTSSDLTLENCWSFGLSSENYDPITVDSNSKIYIKDSTFRATGNSISSAAFYRLDNSTVQVNSVNAYHRYFEGGSNTSGYRIDTSYLKHGNSKTYQGEVGSVTATTGTIVFTMTSATANLRPVLAKITFVGRNSGSNSIGNQPSCEYAQTIVNYTTGVTASSGVTAIYEYQFDSATDYAFADLGSSSCTITLTNPTSGNLTSGYYRVEFIGNDWILNSVTTS